MRWLGPFRNLTALSLAAWRAILVSCLWLPVVATASPVPSRVVSLDLCTDWMLARHLPRERVAALSPFHRRYPVAWVGLDWPAHDGSLEQVLAHKPDLVITGQYNALGLRQRLQALGVRVVVLPLPDTLARITAYEHMLLDAVGQPRGRARQPSGSHADGASSGAVPGGVARPRLLLLGANAIGTGRGTLEHDVISRAGWDNAVVRQGHVALDMEALVRHPPDAILWAAPQHAAQANRFGSHPVLQEVVPTSRWMRSDYWRWQCPGPWTWDLVEQLVAWRNTLR